ncbi:hypothetical protein DFH27DRAFT_58423 [Peziza echinospora]|nr:hypothetical protein DFH27DRAFT_58423 [Peziza echinospora]
MAAPTTQHLPAGKVHDDFAAWASTNGIKISKVKIAAIPNAGIGIVATEDIKAGESLVFTPSASLLTREVISEVLPSLSHITLKHGKERTTHELRTHALIAVGLAIKSYHKQKPWQDVWPSYESFREYMPLLWDTAKQELLPPSALLHLNKQKEKFESDFKKVKELGFTVTRDEYAHNWVIVNTRTLFYKPPTYNDVPREDCMCLCPFIDYFNHCDVGCKVERDAKGFTVTSDREYKAGEQIFVSYGPHNNDFLLCEYGFILDNNRWDEVNIDNYILPRLKPAHQNYLKGEGFLGGYVFDSSTFCFRTQVALRISFILPVPTPTSVRLLRWRQFIEGVDDGAREEVGVQEVFKSIIGQIKFRADEVLAELDDLQESEKDITTTSTSLDQTIRSRWEQILGVVEQLERTWQ